MAITPPAASLGFRASGTSTTCAMTTSANIAAGDFVLIAFNHDTASGTITTNSCTDSGGNTYALLYAYVVGTTRQGVYYKANAAAMATGGTVTIGMSAAHSCNMSGVSFAGAKTSSAVDVTGAGATGSGTTAPTIATGALAEATEIVLGISTVDNVGGTYTPPAGWTAIAGVTGNSSATRIDYIVPGSTSSLNYAPSMSASRTWETNVVSVMAAGAAAPIIGGTLGLMAVG